MKVETVEKTDFQPIELKITIETPQELCDLWHRLNECSFKINGSADTKTIYNSDEESTLGLFEKIHSLMKKNNLFKD